MIGFGQNVNIPDANFKAYLVGNTAINTNGDTEIQVSEATTFNGAINCSQMNISDLTGIEAFTALTYLDCGFNNLTSLDVSNNINLNTLICTFNSLTSLDVSQNTALTELYCEFNQLTSLNVSGATALEDLFCHNNQLTSLDVSQNTALTNLHCNDIQLTSLDVSNNLALTTLACHYNQLTSLDVSNNTYLDALLCDNNQLTSLDVSQNGWFKNLRCNNNQLTSLDLSNNTALTILNCASNQLTSLDLRNGNNQNQGAFDSYNNPNLTCINVDDVQSFPLFGLNIDPQHFFSNDCSTTSIQEHTTNKELLKVTDLLGRETKGTKNEVLFYIYDDGTVEKRIVIE